MEFIREVSVGFIYFSACYKWSEGMSKWGKERIQKINFNKKKGLW